MPDSQKELEGWVSNKLSLFLGFEDEQLAKYILAIDGPRDTEEYLRVKQ